MTTKTPSLPVTAQPTITITVRVDPDTYAQAREAAYADRRSLNQRVAMAIEAQQAREEAAAGGR
jgi:predicted HicB family RNase H-like nuclease